MKEPINNVYPPKELSSIHAEIKMNNPIPTSYELLRHEIKNIKADDLISKLAPKEAREIFTSTISWTPDGSHNICNGSHSTPLDSFVAPPAPAVMLNMEAQ